MIKNEEEAICKTLEPFVEAKFPNFFIYDTGSTDGTIKVVTDFLNLHKCNFIIKQEEFISFGVSRNKSLDYSRDLFPNCKFTLSLDCEWYIKNPQGIIDFCSSLQEPLDECYSVWIQSNLFFCQYRLFVNKHNARYFGAVHEVVISHKSKGICVPKTTYFLYSPTGKGNQKTANRWYRDISLLLKEYKDKSAINGRMKICCKCKLDQPLENFGKLSSSKDGHRYDCKQCRKEYRDTNKEIIKEKQRIYYENNKETLLEKKK